MGMMEITYKFGPETVVVVEEVETGDCIRVRSDGGRRQSSQEFEYLRKLVVERITQNG